MTTAKPVATIHVDGSFVHVEWIGAAPNECNMLVYATPPAIPVSAEQLRSLLKEWQQAYNKMDRDGIPSSTFSSLRRRTHEALSTPAAVEVSREDYLAKVADLTRAKNLLVRLWDKHPETRAQIEGSTGSWFVWGADTDTVPAAVEVSEPVKLKGRARIIDAWNDLAEGFRCAPDMQALYRAVADCEDATPPEAAARFSCHLERDFGKVPCAVDCGKLRCMYPTEAAASVQPFDQRPLAERAAMIAAELDERAEQLTRYTNDPTDGLLANGARIIEELLAIPVVHAAWCSISCAACTCGDTPAPSPKVPTEPSEYLLGYQQGRRDAFATRGPIGAVEPTNSQKIEAILAAADEWAGYVEADRAPMTLSKYLERAILALSRTPGEEA